MEAAQDLTTRRLPKDLRAKAVEGGGTLLGCVQERKSCWHEKRLWRRGKEISGAWGTLLSPPTGLSYAAFLWRYVEALLITLLFFNSVVQFFITISLLKSRRKIKDSPGDST